MRPQYGGGCSSSRMTPTPTSGIWWSTRSATARLPDYHRDVLEKLELLCEDPDERVSIRAGNALARFRQFALMGLV